MLSPRGGGALGHMWGTWLLLPSPTSGIWLGIWVPGWERLLLLRGGMGPRYVVPRACLCAGQLGIGVVPLKSWKRLFLIEVCICFYIHAKTLLLTTRFQYKLTEHHTLWGLCGLLMISTRFSTENENDIFSYLTKFWGPTVGISTKNSSEKSNAPQTETHIDRQTDRHVYLESYTINSTSTTTFQITKNYKQQVINWLCPTGLDLLLPSSSFLFSKHANICFAISFCILTFPLGGFIRNMNILLGDILVILIL